MLTDSRLFVNTRSNMAMMPLITKPVTPATVTIVTGSIKCSVSDQ